MFARTASRGLNRCAPEAVICRFSSRSGVTSSRIQNERPCVESTRSSCHTLMPVTGRDGQVALDGLPVGPSVEGREDPALRAGVQQPLAHRVLAHRAHRIVGGDAVAALGEQPPRGAPVVGAEDVGAEVVQAVARAPPCTPVPGRAGTTRSRPPCRTSASAGGVISFQVAPPSRVTCTRPSSVPAQISRGSVGDSARANTVSKISTPVTSALMGPPGLRLIAPGRPW